MSRVKKLATVGPAVAMTAVSMVLTLAVVVMWLGDAMPWAVALVVGLGLDGGWLATLAYERRLAKQGDHNNAVTATGWAFGAAATAVLVAHALTETSPAAWLAVAWLPLGAKALWLVHGLWERTALTPTALKTIGAIQQTARDEAAVARAQLRAEAGTEVTRLKAVTEAGSRVAEVQSKTAGTLAEAWEALEETRKGESTGRALTCVTERVTPTSQPSWQLPVWGPVEPVPAIEAPSAIGDAELDQLVNELVHSEHPPLSYRELSVRFRAAGHSAGETRLRASWRRVTEKEAAA